MPLDFLGIGAQKAATSWLSINLRQHPNIWLPPLKELHYFDRSPLYPSPSYLASKYLINRLFGYRYNNKEFRKHFKRDLRIALFSRDWERIRWTLRYYLGTYNDDWYLSLFRYRERKLQGEITPSYSILNLEDVKHIGELIPDLKVILIMRNPIDRAWSMVRYGWTMWFNRMSTLNRIQELIDSPAQTLRSDYVRTLSIWNSCFPKEQIHIGFYDDVVQAPQRFMSDIFLFLGVDNIIFSNEETLTNKVNVSLDFEMPEQIAVYLANKYYAELLKLSNLVGGHATVWLKKAERILNAADLSSRKIQPRPH